MKNLRPTQRDLMTLFTRSGEPIKARNRDLRVWTPTGQLRDEVVRVIGQRLMAGDDHNAIILDINISKSVGRRKCAEIANALGLESVRSRHERHEEEVRRRAESGETDGEIAVAMGRTKDSVASIRRKLGLRYGRQLRISAEKNAEIERRLLLGESTRTVAAAVGCQQADVAKRQNRMAARIPTNLPKCDCGKRRNHGGRCNLVIDTALIRARLLSGKTATDIAREYDRTAQSFKPKYIDPVIAELTAEGHLCRCGQPFGHQFACAVTMAVQRRSFTEAERDRATQMIRAGDSVAKVKAELGIVTNSANILVREVRAALAAKGVRCPCGEPINHSRSCTARNGDAKGRTAFRFTCAAAVSMSIESRRKVAKLAREGWQISVIVRRTGESVWRVTQMIEELDRAGQLPAKCAGCDLPRGHKAPCPKSKMCECGRWRYHRGACRRPDGRKNVPFTKLSDEQVADVKRKYRSRYPLRAISRATDIPFSVIQRMVKRWRAASKYELAPCACGRPARHGGSCWAIRSDRIGKRHLTRIEQGIRDGKTSHQISEQLGFSIMTILKHAMPIRDRLYAAGVTCACGRPPNHNFWCSARWDQHGQPRGRRPFPEAQERLAVQQLLRGDVVASIAKAVEVSPDSIWRLRLALTDEQRAERARAIRARIAQGSNLQGEALMARIGRAVSKGMDPMVRDDVMSEIYLAVIEGRIEAEQITTVVRSFVAKGLAQWKSLYGPRSLDATLHVDGTRTLADILGDTTTAIGIDEIEIGGGE